MTVGSTRSNAMRNADRKIANLIDYWRFILSFATRLGIWETEPRKSTKNHNHPTAAVGVNSTTPASHAKAGVTADENSESTARPVVKMAASAQSFTGSVGGGHRKDADGIMITDALTDVREKYHIEAKELGHGHYGVVRKCMNRETKEWLAIKSIRKAKVSKIEVLKRYELLRDRVVIMS